MRRALGSILIGLLAATVSHLTFAEVKKNDFGVLVGYIAPTSDSDVFGTKTEAEATVDYGLEYKHKFLESNSLGLGVSVLYSQFDIKAGGTNAGTIDNIPILVDLNWNFLENKNMYLGVTAGYSMWGDVEPPSGVAGSPVKVKQNVVYGANFGWDILIGERWAFLTNLRYLGQEVETDTSGVPTTKIKVNPVVANIGFAIRF